MNVQSKNYGIRLDAERAVPTSLRLEEKELLMPLHHTSLFSLTALDGENQRIQLLPQHGRAEGETLVFDSLTNGTEAVKVQATLAVALQDNALQFRLHIKNSAPKLRIVETVFSLEGIAMPNPASTELLYPHHAGEKIHDPVKALRSKKYQSFWRAYTRLENGRWVRECNYCGLCSMSWMYLQSTDIGLYLASHDSRFPVTGLMVSAGAETDDLAMGFRVHKSIAYGEEWESGAFVLHLSHDDWHAGARRYRAWILPHLDIQSNPAFLQEQAALNQCYNFKRTEQIQHRFEDIPDMWEEGAKRGINHMFIASWNRTGFDSFYPEYYPDMELGTALDFRRGIDYVNAHGGFATLYVNARLSDQFSDFHQRFLSRMQIENEHGQPLTETYGPHTFTLNCPSDRMWQHMLVDACDFAAESYHLKGIYLDQLASAEPFACYHQGHSHEDIGQFNQGYLTILRELLGRMRVRDPQSYLMTENCGDIYSAYTWGNLTWNGADYDEFYNLFRYTFPEFVQVNMCNDRSWEPDAVRKESFFYSDIERCILMGNILWIGITSRYLGHPELKEHFDYLMKATAFRKAIAHQVSRGTYLDDEYVEENDNLSASCFRICTQEALLLVGNHACTGGTVRFHLPFAIASAQAWDENENELPISVTENDLTICINRQRLVRITVHG